MVAEPGAGDPLQILDRMKACLHELDRIGAGLPAIHLATAIETFKDLFIIPGNPSELD